MSVMATTIGMFRREVVEAATPCCGGIGIGVCASGPALYQTVDRRSVVMIYKEHPKLSSWVIKSFFLNRNKSSSICASVSSIAVISKLALKRDVATIRRTITCSSTFVSVTRSVNICGCFVSKLYLKVRLKKRIILEIAMKR
jgi:hypothetical protein